MISHRQRFVCIPPEFCEKNFSNCPRKKSSASSTFYTTVLLQRSARSFFKRYKLWTRVIVDFRREFPLWHCIRCKKLSWILCSVVLFNFTLELRKVIRVLKLKTFLTVIFVLPSEWESKANMTRKIKTTKWADVLLCTLYKSWNGDFEEYFSPVDPFIPHSVYRIEIEFYWNLIVLKNFFTHCVKVNS